MATSNEAPGLAPTTKRATDGNRPTLLLREPWPMPPPELPVGAAFERIESGWWDEHDVRRDYTTLDINGGRAWVFRELSTQQWFLHGWWS